MRASSEGHPELAVAWVLHALEPHEEAEFAEHLADCAACREIVAETEEVGALLGSAAVPEDPPPALRDRILAAEASEATDTSGASDTSGAPGSGEPSGGGPSTVVPMRSRRGMRRATAALAVAAAAALVVAIGGLVVANRDLAAQRDAATAQADRSRQVVELVDAASRPGTPHTVLATTTGQFVGLVVDRGAGPEFLATGLPPNDAGHTYVLWGLAGGRPVGLQAFDVAAAGPITASVPSTAASTRFGGFAVSYEPGRTVPAAPTQVVASGQLAG